MAKISKRLVDAIKAPAPHDNGKARQSWIWDDQLKGFGIAVRSTGVHSYVFNYRDQHGRLRNITIGKVGTLTPDEARKHAEKHQRAVRDGKSPIAQKRAARKALTVNDLLDAYLVSDRFRKKAASTQLVDRGRIEGHLRPLLGKQILETLGIEDVRLAHRKIVAGKTAKTEKSGKKRGVIRIQGGEGTARMAIRLFRSILRWGGTETILPAGCDPDLAAGVEIGSDGARAIILGKVDDYARLWRTLDRLTNPNELKDGEKLLRMEAADAIRVIALTGARRSEIAGLRWSHVDLKAGTITLPPDSHKTGNRTGANRVIGLPSLASAIIARQPEGRPSDLVFKPARNGQRIDLSAPWREVRKAAELPEGMGLHGLRHSLASHMAMAGAQAAEIMTALGHRDITTSQKYVHWANDQRQILAEKAAAGISAAITGQAVQSDNVIDMKERG